MSFKILGINILSGCDKKYTKVLNPNEIYKFYQNYEISINGDHYDIENTDNSLDKLFCLKGKKDISVSAIVGKNGSGKSSLVELLYQAVYNISCIKGILYNEEIDDYLSKDDIINYINLDIIFEVDSKYFVLRIVNYDVMIWDNSSNKLSNYNDNKQFFESFCYTIAVNYSLHSLNEKNLGPWIRNIFHKNDAYQTPIVINPYRDFGKINISREEYLVNSRLIANILSNSSAGEQKSNFTRSLLNGKKIRQLNVTLDKEKLNLDLKNKDSIREKRKRLNHNLLIEVYRMFLGEQYYYFDNESDWANIYILRKIESIVEKYPTYFKFQSVFKRYKTSDVGNLVLALLKDKSHITFKLRQAIYYQINPYFKEKGSSFTLDIHETSNVLNELSEKYKADLIELIPPSFFDIEIDLGDSGKFEDFSSGEKQKVFTLSTVVYHLLNLNSVNEKNRTLNTYKNINLIFDEVELYFHPEFQRTYVSDLIDIINKTELDNITGINCLFITHSPFILSDIPISNILFLNEDGKALQPYNEQTFGANIHDLLKNNFFLDKGFYGEFAKSKIREVILFIRYRYLLKEVQFNSNIKEKRKFEKELNKMNTENLFLDNVDFYLAIINNIGEPVIRVKLKEMYIDTLSENEKDNWIDNEIERLENLKS